MMTTGRKKIKVKITTPGFLKCFGYNGLRTPAVVELYEHQLAVLRANGTEYVIIEDKPTYVAPTKKSKTATE